MSFEEIYTSYYNELRRFGRQLNISAERSEDMIQETFLRFYLELKKDVVFNNPRAWLYKVFLNQFKTLVDSKERKNSKSEFLNKRDEPAQDPHEDYIKNERHQIIIQMLDQMTKKDKEILWLYHNGFSYAEMAEIIGINPNSIGKKLVRAIDNLKEMIKIHYHEMFEQN